MLSRTTSRFLSCCFNDPCRAPAVKTNPDTSDGPADDHDLRAPEILQGTPEIFHPSLEAPARLPGSGSTHVQKDFVKADHFCTDGALPNKRSVPVQTDHFCPDSAFLYTRSVPVQTEHSPEHFQVPAPASHPSQPALCWESLAGLLETIPFALAITTSDGVEVLQHAGGSEPAAAQALRQVLQFRHPAAAKDVQQAAETSSSACSFLSALLGHKMAGDAMVRAHKGRSWRGSITMHLPYRVLSSSCGDGILSGARVSTPAATPGAATALVAGGDNAELAEPALNVYVRKSSLKQGSSLISAGLRDPVGSLESPRRENSCKGVRWSFLRTEPQASVQLEQDEDLFRLSSESGHPHEVALPRGSHNEGRVSSPVPANLGGISAPVYSETCGSIASSHMKGPEVDGARSGASSPAARRSKSSSDLRLSRWGSQSTLLMSEREIEQFMTRNDGLNTTRTVALLRSLAQKMEATENIVPQQSPFKKASEQAPFDRGVRSSPQAGVGNSLYDTLGSCNPPNPEEEHGVTPHGARPETPDNTQELILQSFDIFVSLLRPQERERSPLVVLVSNSTQHLQVQSTLSTLAESQLELLSSIMPQHAIQFLALESTEAVPRHVAELAHAHTGVTLLFMDIVGFTSMCKSVEPVDVMVFLNTLFSLFDQLTDIYGVHKVETAGDCYIVSGGIVSTSPKGFGLVVEERDPTESAVRVMEFAKALLDTAKQVKMPDTKEPVRVRVGMHTGNVVSGLIGSKLPKFSIFGDTMNTASRMESTGIPGRIHVSEATQRLLQNVEHWEPTGGVEVKGKGKMQTFLWVPQPHRPPSNGQVLLPIIENSDSEVSETLPGTLLKTTNALLSQLHMTGPSIYPVPSESQISSLCLLRQKVEQDRPLSF